jgi:hypothetical protein
VHSRVVGADSGAGTWNLGYCVKNYGPNAISNNDFVNGWIMVTNQ